MFWCVLRVFLCTDSVCPCDVHHANAPLCFQAAEKAVAQSNREISGYQVASISMTADRIAHYQQVSGGGEELQRMFQDIEPAHPFALSLQGLLPQLASAQAQQANLSALGAQNLMLSHQQGLPTLGGDNPLGPLTGLGGEVNYSLDDASLHPSAFAWSQQQLSHQQLGQQQSAQQLPFAKQALSQQALEHAQYVQRSATQQPSQLPATPHQDLPFLVAGLLQPHVQEALLSSDMARAANLHTPTEFSSNLHGLSNAQYAQLSHQRLLQQQAALGPQPGHQVSAVQHPQPGQPFGPMLNFSSNHLDGTSAFLLPSGPVQRSVGLTQQLGQGNPTQPPLQLQAQPRSQDFNPSVGARRPDQSGNNFGEAPSVMQIPLMEPHLIAQIPDLPRADSYGPRRRTLLPHNARHGPY